MRAGTRALMAVVAMAAGIAGMGAACLAALWAALAAGCWLAVGAPGAPTPTQVLSSTTLVVALWLLARGARLLAADLRHLDPRGPHADRPA